MGIEGTVEVVQGIIKIIVFLIVMLVLFVGGFCYYLGSRNNSNSNYVDKSPKQVTDR